MPPLAQTCIASWKKHCPQCAVMEWNEDSFDVALCPYVHEAYQSKQWAFVADVARLYALMHYGGIYMDTDVEVLRPLDELMKNQAFLGYESTGGLSTAMMGCERMHPAFVAFYQAYHQLHFLKSDGSYDMTTNVKRVTEILLGSLRLPDKEIRQQNGVTIYPAEFLSPLDFKSGVSHVTERTFAIHLFDGSWLPALDRKLMLRRWEVYKRWGALAPPMWWAVWFIINMREQGVGGTCERLRGKLAGRVFPNRH